MPPKKKAAAAIPTTMEGLLAQLDQRYGSGRVVRREEVTEYQVIPTGSLTLDYATRVGGWIRGRTHEIVGVEGVGKTTLAICGAIEAQALYPDLAVGFIDMEQTFDYDWAEALGLDTSKNLWVHLYPDNSEDVADMLRMQTRTGLFSMIIVDSIGGMESKQALSKDAEDVDMGSNAKVITRMVKAVAVLARQHEVAILFINQLRANLSGMGQDISAGPKALKYNTTMKVDLRRASGDQPSDTQITMKFDDNPDPIPIGVKIKSKIVRNKVAPAGFSGEFWIFNVDTPEWGPVGINRADEAMAIGLRLEIIKQAGAFYTLPDGRKYQGRAKVQEALNEDLGMIDDIRARAIEMMAGDVTPEVEVTLEAADA